MSGNQSGSGIYNRIEECSNKLYLEEVRMQLLIDRKNATIQSLNSNEDRIKQEFAEVLELKEQVERDLKSSQNQRDALDQDIAYRVRKLSSLLYQGQLIEIALQAESPKLAQIKSNQTASRPKLQNAEHEHRRYLEHYQEQLRAALANQQKNNELAAAWPAKEALRLASLEELRQASAEKHGRLLHQCDAITAISDDLAKLTRESEDLEQQVVDTEEDCKEKASLEDKLSEEVLELEFLVKATRMRLEATDSHMKEALQQSEAMEEELKSAQSSIASQEQESEQICDKIRAVNHLKERLNVAIEKRRLADHDVEKKRVELSASIAAIGRLDEQLAAYNGPNQQLDAAQQRMDSLTRAELEDRTRLQLLLEQEADLREHQAECDATCEQLDASKQAVSHLEQRIAQLSQLIREKQSEGAEAIQDIKTCHEAEMGELKATLQSLQDKLASLMTEMSEHCQKKQALQQRHSQSKLYQEKCRPRRQKESEAVVTTSSSSSLKDSNVLMSGDRNHNPKNQQTTAAAVTTSSASGKSLMHYSLFGEQRNDPKKQKQLSADATTSSSSNKSVHYLFFGEKKNDPKKRKPVAAATTNISKNKKVHYLFFNEKRDNPKKRKPASAGGVTSASAF